MKGLILNIFYSFLILLVCNPVDARAYSYVVKKGDTLSHHVAGIFIPGPVWGKYGSFKKLLKLNPSIRDPNHLVPGTRVELGDSVVLQSSPAPQSRAPASETSIKKPDTDTDTDTVSETKRRSRLALTPYYSTTTLTVSDQVTGKTSSFFSQIGFGVRGQYLQEWSQNFKSFIGLKLGYLSFEPPTDASKAFPDRSKTTSGMSFGGNYFFQSDFSLTTTAKYEKEIFARATSTTGATLDTVSIPSVEAKISYDLVSLSPFTFGVSGVSGLTFPASTDAYQIRLGESFGGTIYIREQTNEKGDQSENFQTELGVFTRSQNTTLVHQTENDLILSVRIFIGGSQKETKSTK